MLEFDYAAQPDRSRASVVLRVVVFIYGIMLLPFVTAVLPRDVEVLWPWMIIGGALLVLLVVGSIPPIARAKDVTREYKAPPAWALLVQAAVGYSMVAAFGYGLSGGVGIYRVTLVGPLLLIAATGNRHMFLAACGLCFAVVAGTTAGSDLPIKVMPAVILSYSFGFLGIGLLVRAMSQTAVRALERSDLFVNMATIATRGDNIVDGLNEMLPITAQFLDVSGISVHAVTNRRVTDEPLAAWPWWLPALPDDRKGDLRIAAIENRAVLRDRWACFSVPSVDGVRLAVYVERDAGHQAAWFLSPFDLERAAVPLGALLARRDLIDRLENQTRTDVLTELPNRRALSDTLEHEFAVAERTNSPLAMAMIDLDHFKSYNDTFGHVAGDELLQQIGEMLRTRVRSTDFVARYGGEEFAVILPFTTTEDAEVMLGELLRRCGDLQSMRPVTFSGGIANWDGHESPIDLISRADAALYAAKEAGRARLCIARPPRTGGARARTL